MRTGFVLLDLLKATFLKESTFWMRCELLGRCLIRLTNVDLYIPRHGSVLNMSVPPVEASWSPRPRALEN